MSTQVTYKGNTIANFTNDTKTLKTAGKYMEDDVTITEIITGDGYVWQDQDGYVHLSDEPGTHVSVAPLSVTENGTYTAPTGRAYSPVTVSVGGGDEPEPWVRPSDWPDLSLMDVSDGNIFYMTSYADEARGFCYFSIATSSGGTYTVEVGHIEGSSFVTESTYTYNNGTTCGLYYGSANGTYKVLRVTASKNITSLYFYGGTSVQIDGFNGYNSNQGIIDIVGELPFCVSIAFSALYNIVHIDLNKIKPATLSSTFSNCISLTSLDVSGWDTSALTSMNSTFSNCYSLTSLDVNGWDTSALTNIGSTFNNCYSLKSLDVSGWNTSAVTTMSSTFNNCSSLKSLDVSGWNTSAVKSMNNMFSNCRSLKSLDVSGWNTSAVTIMSSMFNSCYSLKSLDVSEWNISAVKNTSSMFSNCSSLKSLDVSEWNTSAVTNMSSMFNSCYSLKSLDVSGWDTSAVTNMGNMFNNCSSLKSLDVSGWNFSNNTSNSNSITFAYCYGLHKSITLPSNFTYIVPTCFTSCRSLYEWHFLSTTPPTLQGVNAFSNMTDFGGKKIYVPYSADHSVLNAYKTATNWSTYAQYIEEEPQ